jgi:hypothetical protein
LLRKKLAFCCAKKEAKNCMKHQDNRVPTEAIMVIFDAVSRKKNRRGVLISLLFFPAFLLS